MSKPILEIDGLTKSFGSVQACVAPPFMSTKAKSSPCSATMAPANHAHQGDLRRLSGRWRYDTPERQAVTVRKPRDAMELGIETIHQDSSLAPHLSIARNLFLGRELSAKAGLDFSRR